MTKIGQREARIRRVRRTLGGVAGLAALLWAIAAVGGSLYAQCPMCYASASAMGPQAKHALNVGILLLILPVASIIGGIATFTYRNREPK